MIKNILVPQDGSTHSTSALNMAIWVAKKFDARITGLYVVDSVAMEGSFLHDISGSMGFEPFMDFSSKMKEVLEENGKQILDIFEETCKEAGVEGHRLTASGIVSAEICEHAKLSDLVIMGRRGINAGFEYALMGSVAESTIRRSEKPVIIMPEEFAEPKNPLLAYDGGVHSSKALHSAAEFAKACSLPLTVVTVDEAARAGELLKEVEDYLEPYGLDAKFIHVEGYPHAELVKLAEEDGYDMFFMGASHHSRVVALVLGSTTEYVMRMVELPFFVEK